MADDEPAAKRPKKLKKRSPWLLAAQLLPQLAPGVPPTDKEEAIAVRDARWALVQQYWPGFKGAVTAFDERSGFFKVACEDGEVREVFLSHAAYKTIVVAAPPPPQPPPPPPPPPNTAKVTKKPKSAPAATNKSAGTAAAKQRGKGGASAAGRKGRASAAPETQAQGAPRRSKRG